MNSGFQHTANELCCVWQHLLIRLYLRLLIDIREQNCTYHLQIYLLLQAFHVAKWNTYFCICILTKRKTDDLQWLNVISIYDLCVSANHGSFISPKHDSLASTGFTCSSVESLYSLSYQNKRESFISQINPCRSLIACLLERSLSPG